MSTYIIGDIHGCADELNRLLRKIKFNRLYDKLILAGDLVGRGPASEEVIAQLMEYGDAVVKVLGNHDLKLLATHYGLAAPKKSDRTERLLRSPRAKDYVAWLEDAKFAHWDEGGAVIVVHGGIPLNWPVSQLRKQVKLLEESIAEHGYEWLLRKMYSVGLPDGLSNDFESNLIYTAQALTRVKFVDSNGLMNTSFNCAPGSQPDCLYPWYACRDVKRNAGYKIVFGHWAALGMTISDYYICCDDGCVWGGNLCAVNLDDLSITKVASDHKADA
ncbi:Diadenosine tetraphosphatase and related serine/threonine protein phosphatase [Hahella chejuensis KCTC 2396]|uniref:bis(5'-nucleosyl)-tetraphosphatase (symmetrical) n=1 Tax=Hahella chejuensis (strain KCTC 2396) TaxID=349521 RepID=Q2S854_HAHCH|nr:symmetrical bis(5'-nucleosyl)-tetraphosphatase [Hahella chejuensis]ABC33170.1 Diadenosine tetraphosphatase and related serine/threonine protein phosphatase [Hahella chejuensis KCTC 2396]